MKVLTDARLADYERDGYVHLPRAFENTQVLDALIEAYTEYLAAACVVLGASRSLSLDPKRPIEELLAALVLHAPCALDSVWHLPLQLPDFHFRRDLALTPPRELFTVLRHASILDNLEPVLGGEIASTSLTHVHFKFPRALADRLQEELRRSGRPNDRRSFVRGVNVGTTDWHWDMAGGAPRSLDEHQITVWVPLTECTEETGTLAVVPGSHREVFDRAARKAEYDARARTITAVPGDIVLMHGRVVHGSTPNVSDKVRWSFSFRYAETSASPNRSFLPRAVVRSRRAPESEVKSSYLWSSAMHAALGFLQRHEVPFSVSVAPKLEDEALEALEARWAPYSTSMEDWISLVRFLPAPDDRPAVEACEVPDLTATVVVAGELVESVRLSRMTLETVELASTVSCIAPLGAEVEITFEHAERRTKTTWRALRHVHTEGHHHLVLESAGPSEYTTLFLALRAEATRRLLAMPKLRRAAPPVARRARTAARASAPGGTCHDL